MHVVVRYQHVELLINVVLLKLLLLDHVFDHLLSFLHEIWSIRLLCLIRYSVNLRAIIVHRYANMILL